VGVVVGDTSAKRYLTRAIGPALTQFGASGVVPDPQLAVFGPGAVALYRNLGWATGPDATRFPQLAQGVGAFALPASSAGSALIVGLGASTHTLQMTTPSGRNGIALAELHELDAAGRTVNRSTRARVGTDDRVLIGGFVVAGAAHKRMLIRAVGPALSVFGLTGALADPVLTLYSGNQVRAANDRWWSDPAAAIAAASARVGAFALPPNSEDAALLLTVAPGAYTVEVRGKGGAEGVALLEIYEIPQTQLSTCRIGSPRSPRLTFARPAAFHSGMIWAAVQLRKICADGQVSIFRSRTPSSSPTAPAHGQGLFLLRGDERRQKHRVAPIELQLPRTRHAYAAPDALDRHALRHGPD
jgi:hypothetical protein